MKYFGKKLLILGGASVHVKLISAAHKLGAYVIVTDNVEYEKSPGKQIADEYWDINIFDVDLIVDKAKKIGIDGVISGWLDPCQKPYCDICEELRLPCYCTNDQVSKLSDKQEFKKLCREFDVNTIPDFTLDDVKNKTIKFPVFVKPTDSRGSRGQNICFDYEQLKDAIKKARDESRNGEILIEKYLDSFNEFHVTYFFIDGEPYLVRTSDNYCGSKDLKMEKVVSCAIMPSRYTERYINTSHCKVITMLKSLGIKYGPVLMQGLSDGDKFIFFDPGFRFAGVDFELVFKKVFDVDFMEAMVDIAFTGKCHITIPTEATQLNHKMGSVLYLKVKACTIAKISGEKEIVNCPDVVSYWKRKDIGDRVEWSYNVNQRLAEIDILSGSIKELIRTINFVQSKILVKDREGNDVIYDKFDTERLKGLY